MLLLARSWRLQSFSLSWTSLAACSRGHDDFKASVSVELHWLPVAARVDFKIAVITFNLLTTEQPSYLREHLVTYVNCSSCVDRRDRLRQAIYWTFHDHALHLYSGVLHALPLVSEIYCLIQSPTIWTSLHQFSNPDLKHSSTEGPISNHSMTLTVPTIRLIGRHTACF